jgi:hypothetical protein
MNDLRNEVTEFFGSEVLLEPSRGLISSRLRKRNVATRPQLPQGFDILPSDLCPDHIMLGSFPVASVRSGRYMIGTVTERALDTSGKLYYIYNIIIFHYISDEFCGTPFVLIARNTKLHILYYILYYIVIY